MEVNSIQELEGEKDRRSSTRGQEKLRDRCLMVQGMLIGWSLKETQVELTGKWWWMGW